MRERKLLIFAAALVLLLLLAIPAYRGLSSSYVPAELPAAESVVPEMQEETAPDFTVYDTEGSEIRLSDLRGKPVVINFWASWCPPCREELPFFDAAWAERGEEIAFLMVNLTDGGRETMEGVQSFLSDKGYGFPVCYDTELEAAMAYGVSSIPLTVLIDAQGRLVDRHLGSMTEAQLEIFLNKLG